MPVLQITQVLLVHAEDVFLMGKFFIANLTGPVLQWNTVLAARLGRSSDGVLAVQAEFGKGKSRRLDKNRMSFWPCGDSVCLTQILRPEDKKNRQSGSYFARRFPA